MRRVAPQEKLDAQPGQPDQRRMQNELRDIAMIYDARSEVPSGSIAYRMIVSLGFDPVLILILTLIVFPSFFWFVGFSEGASTKRFFTFTRSGTEYLVLRIFDERLIAVPFDRKGCEYTEEFSIASMTDVAGLKPVRLEERNF